MSEQVQLVFLQTHIEDAHERLAVTGLEKRVEATDVVKESRCCQGESEFGVWKLPLYNTNPEEEQGDPETEGSQQGV